MINAVIFDLDGTLIDSERIYRVFWKDVCREAGYMLTDEQFYQLRSLGHPEAEALMKRWFGPEFDYATVQGNCSRRGSDYMEQTGFLKKPGVTEVLEGLKTRGIRTAIATATEIGKARRSLMNAGIDPEAFDNIISADGIAHGKPAPDVYLFAADAMGLPAVECLAAEDSPNGIRAAHDAGMYVVYVPDLTPPEDGDRPYFHETVPALDGILPMVDRLNS